MSTDVLLESPTGLMSHPASAFVDKIGTPASNPDQKANDPICDDADPLVIELPTCIIIGTLEETVAQEPYPSWTKQTRGEGARMRGCLTQVEEPSHPGTQNEKPDAEDPKIDGEGKDLAHAMF